MIIHRNYIQRIILLCFCIATTVFLNPVLGNNSPVKKESLSSIIKIVNDSEIVLPVEKRDSDIIPVVANAITPKMADNISKQFDFPNLDKKITQQLKNQYPDLLLSDDNTNLATEDKLEDIFIKLAEYDASEKIAKARGALAKAREIGSFIKKLSGEDLVSLPLVHADTISNVIFTLAIQSIRFYPNYSELEVYMGIEIPEKDVVLFFGSPNIKFSSSGGIIGDAVLGLYADCPLPIGGNKAAFLLKKYYRNPAVGYNTTDDPNTHLGTFVRIDCDGFVEMGLDAEIIFSKDWILPINQNRVVIPNQRVVARVATIVTNWNNMLLTINLPNFTLARNQEFAFNLSNAVLDFSDFRNDPNVVFPEEYAQQHLLPENPNLWRGVYIQNIEVALPHPFRKKGCTETAPPATPAGGATKPGLGAIDLPNQSHYAYWDDGFDEPISGPNAGAVPIAMVSNTVDEEVVGECRIVFGADHLLIDQMGVSALFYAENILPLNEGAMDKWAFSVDSVKVEVTMNKITAFGFAGKIVVPITKETTALFYAGFWDDAKNYKIAIGIAEDLEFPLWRAGEVSLEAGSKVEVAVINNRFKPRAILSGTVTIGIPSDDNEPDGKKTVKAPSIEFKKLVLQTQAHYIGIAAATPTEAAGYFKLNEDIKIAGFPVSISEIGLRREGTSKCALDFVINIDMMDEDDHGFAASGGFSVVGNLSSAGGVQTWKYDSFLFQEAEIIIVLPKVAAYGYLNIFRNDEDYGDGFQAALMMEIMDGKFNVEANAIFGNTYGILGEENGYRYWYVDGFVGFSPSIPVAGPLAINGFGGGLYHHMKLDGYDPTGGSGLGVTTSGLKYKPSLDISFGLKASVGVEFVNPTAAAGEFSGTVTGVATLELAFGNASNGTSGLQYISLLVSAEMMSGSSSGDSQSAVQSKIKARQARLAKNEQQTKEADKNDAKISGGGSDQIKASIHIVMDFSNGFDMYGMLAVYAKLAGGRVTGVGPSGLVGAAHLLIKTSSNPKQWHIYVGGKFNPKVYVQDFSGNQVQLYPVGLKFEESSSGLYVYAHLQTYLMVGNDIQGPGYPPNSVLDKFKISLSDLVTTSGVEGKMAKGTGFLFGADANIKVEFDLKNKNGKKKGWVKIDSGIGFNIGLLKYGSSAKCYENGQSPVGAKGWRASGNVWGYVDLRGKYRGIGPKNLTLGIILWGDLPRPTHVGGKVKIGPFRPKFKAGKKCTVVL